MTNEKLGFFGSTKNKHGIDKMIFLVKVFDFISNATSISDYEFKMKSIFDWLNEELSRSLTKKEEIHLASLICDFVYALPFSSERNEAIIHLSNGDFLKESTSGSIGNAEKIEKTKTDPIGLS
jgi:hypothetical protein